MPTIRLTRDAIHSLVPAEKIARYFDAGLPGFGVQVTPAGARSFIVDYRPGAGGRSAIKRRITLGSVEALTLEQARKRAKEILAAVRLGADPAAEKAEARSAITVKDLATRWLDEEIRPTRKPRTAELYEMYLEKHVLPELGTVRARELTRGRVAKLHRAIGENAAVTANRVIQAMSGLFSWAVKSGELPDNFPNPAKGITKFREVAKERFLSGEEVQRLGDALRLAETDGLPWSPDPNKKTKHVPKTGNAVVFPRHITAAIRLLLLTGCRLREILHLKWESIDWERGLAILEDSKTGRKPVILPAPALAILESLERFGPYVIPGDDLNRPRHDLKKPWDRISKHAGLDDVRLHDLRHSFAATGAGAGFGLPVLGRLLGHSQPSTTARYAHLAADPVRAAADRIGNDLARAMGEAITDSRDGGEVVPLEGRRGK